MLQSAGCKYPHNLSAARKAAVETAKYAFPYFQLEKIK